MNRKRSPVPPAASLARSQTPAGLGYSHPAEWEPHCATWIGWPHNRTDWPGKMSPIQWVYTEIVRKVALGEVVRVFVNSEEHEASARRTLQRAGVLSTEKKTHAGPSGPRKGGPGKPGHSDSPVEFFRIPTNRGWTRDFGPLFVRREHPKTETAIVKFGFNAWAKYPDWKLDNAAVPKAARKIGATMFEAVMNGRDFVLEGGSIDLNGRGSILTTEECLLDQQVQPRNPGLNKKEIEAVFRDYLGATNVLWLGRGIAGDDTHGHVDDLCRFVSPSAVVLCREADRADPNYSLLEENRERLEGMRLEDGSKIEVIPIPMPSPLYFDGRRLPASYANFYICNSAVLVPTFNDPNDRVALGIIAELITDRPVVGLHSVDLVWGLGTIHCMTHEEPAAT